MAVGFPTKVTYANGDVFSADDINSTNGTINLLGSSVAYAAGKNEIINGAFNVWQRGTSFSVPASTNVFTADRWQAFVVGTTSTASQQAFTPGTAPASPYESQYFHRIATGAVTTYYELQQRIEDVRTLAGQSVTYSFWAKASNAHTAAVYINQNFGVSGSANVGTASQNISLTTSWQRFSLTFTLGSMSGKTIGASSYINPFIYYVSGTVASTNIDLWGVQLEQGSTATAFQTATGTIQGELAACQRYYWQYSANSSWVGMGTYVSSGFFAAVINHPTTMRANPTLSSTTGTNYYQTVDSGTTDGLNSITIYLSSPDNAYLYNNTDASGTAYRPAFLMFNNASAKLGFDSEL
jgi:hypothetical protein